MKLGTTRILVGDCIQQMRTLTDQSVHTCITSPPYWGLRSYIDDADEIGREPSLEEHMDRLVDVFREVRRVLRDDGSVWVNYGSAYAGTGKSGGSGQGDKWKDIGAGATKGKGTWQPPPNGYKSGDDMMLPHRLAFALQADGWCVRSAIVWAKGVSFCDTYHGSVMPESMNGWRWERCRVKVGHIDPSRKTKQLDHENRAIAGLNDRYFDGAGPQWSPCPGCDKCRANDGLVLRKGKWRPTSAYEMVFLLSKGGDYFMDMEAVREKGPGGSGGACVGGYKKDAPGSRSMSAEENDAIRDGSRNLRNVWTIGTEAYSEAHFATYPRALVRPMIEVATSSRGVCPECGSPWARVVENTPMKIDRSDRGEQIGGRNGRIQASGTMTDPGSCTTLGWRPACGCDVGKLSRCADDELRPQPATVLDPFGGSGTTALVANQLGRNAIICELNPEYADMARDRIGREVRPMTYVSSGSTEDDGLMFASDQ